jgi:hypothetical protein
MDGRMKEGLATKKGFVGTQGKDNRGIRNPFEEFDTFSFKKTQIPLDQIIESTEVVMDQIRRGYEKLLEEEAKELVWMVQYNTIIKAYEVAEKHVREIDYSAEDIEDFCFALENTQRFLISFPRRALYLCSL